MCPCMIVIVEKDICCSGTRDPEGPIVAANIRVILARRRSDSGGDVARRFMGFGLMRREPTGGVVFMSPVVSDWSACCPV
jgi:hypothetical protein